MPTCLSRKENSNHKCERLRKIVWWDTYWCVHIRENRPFLFSSSSFPNVIISKKHFERRKSLLFVLFIFVSFTNISNTHQCRGKVKKKMMKLNQKGLNTHSLATFWILNFFRFIFFKNSGSEYLNKTSVMNIFNQRKLEKRALERKIF